MEIAVPEPTKHGVIKGRDALFLDKIIVPTETELVLAGDINTYGGPDEKYEIRFTSTIYISMIEFDFADGYGDGGSFGVIENSQLVEKLKRLDSADKLVSAHKHFYFCTYDTVFQIVAADYELGFSPL